ncbi:hypothetical protein DVH24_041841 [Malus domestica]|uniref:Uncharacterized protein n=1 Tax=Malus domestica TaxID=3750 RepID=A0A498IUM8_MALDO|nr:hypothetical protein DVH24_041841 [Malus domestica]
MIGFAVGFYSAYLIANMVGVEHNDNDEQGKKITLHLKEEELRLVDLIKHSAFISYSISLWI